MNFNSDGYTYNEANTIRTRDSLEKYAQRTPDGADMVAAYIDEVEYKRAGKWAVGGFRWAIVEPHLTDHEIVQWLLNNGLSRVPFIRD